MSKTIRVTDLGYVENRDDVIVRISARDENGDKSIHYVEGTRPCCWIREEARIPDDVENLVMETNTGYETFDGVSVKQVVTYLPKHVKSIREEVDDHWEADVPYVRRVSVDHDLTGYLEVPEHEQIHISDIESLDAEDVDNIPPRVFIADIETMPPDSPDDWNDFVDNAEEPVLMITVYDTYEEEYICLVRDPDNEVDGTKVRDELQSHWYGSDSEFDYYANSSITLISASTEFDLLDSFVDLVDERNPDLLSGWNWVQFDHQYLLNRMDNFSEVNKERLSHFRDVGGYQLERKISGLPGFDMMEAFCDQMTFHDWRSKSLDYVSNEELGIGKIEDIDIEQNYNSNKSRLLAYNIIDVQLTVALDEIYGIHEFFYLLAELSSVQIYDTFSAMRLVDGFIMSRRGDNEILPSTEEKDLDPNAGGLVLKPSNGISEWVAVLDLKSLYPSAFITTNASTETITKNPRNADVVVPWMPEKEEDVPGHTIEESDVIWDIQKGIGVSLETEGIIPKYLRKLFETRNSMKTTRNSFDPDTDEYQVWDNRQNAVKVVMNSFYGVSSNNYWRLSTPELGDTITAAARYVTWKGVEIAKELGYTVRYGDSVPAEEPVLIRKDDRIDVVEIQKLEDYENDIQVWSDEGFTQVNNVIRKPNRKDMYRTRTKRGVVNTTEDHGLLYNTTEEVSPKDISTGEELLHKDVRNILLEGNHHQYRGDMSSKKAWLYGFFAAEGHASTKENASRYRVAISNKEREELEKAKSILYEEFDVQSKICEFESNGDVLSLTVHGDVKQFAQKMRRECYSGYQKKVPKNILNSLDEDVIRSFLDGFYVGDGDNSEYADKYREKYHSFDCKDAVLSQCIVVLLKRIGKHVRVDNRDGYYNIVVCNKDAEDAEEVTKVECINYDGDYVYDLQTDNHHFHSGVGDIIVHNTDSIMIELADPEENVSPEEVRRRGEEIEEIINEEILTVAEEFGITDHPYLSENDSLHGTGTHCFTWEFEKLYRRFFQAGSKKRYSGLIYWKEGKWLVDPKDADPEDADLDVTGYESQRSDIPEITEKVQVDIMTKVLNGEGFEDVSEYVQDVVEKIKQEEIPLRRIAKPGAINKALSEYPNREVPRACEYMNTYKGYSWGEGDDPWIYYVDKTPPMEDHTDVIALDWNEDPPEGFNLDLRKHIEKFVNDPIEGVINEAGWTFEEVKTGKKSQSIDVSGDASSSFDDISSNSPTDLHTSQNPFTGNNSNEEKEEEDNEKGALDW